MYIATDKTGDITQIVWYGDKPEADFVYEIDTIEEPYMSQLNLYNYINGQFVRKEDISNILQNIKETKLKNLSEICRDLIEQGIDYNDEHFSLSVEDQINLSKIATTVALSPNAPIFYHADNKLCRQFTPDEITNIVNIATMWITFNTTYYNFLKDYILKLDNIDDIISINYGEVLPDEYENQMKHIISTNLFTRPHVVDTFDYSKLFVSISQSDIDYANEQKRIDNIELESTYVEQQIDENPENIIDSVVLSDENMEENI